MKKYVSWEQVEDYVQSVPDINAKGVYGLPRGGLVLAVMLSHRFDIPLLTAPCEGCIIVDDICDSGESLIHYVKNSSGKLQNYFITTMFKKANPLGIEPDFSMFEKGKDWIVFPWEAKED